MSSFQRTEHKVSSNHVHDEDVEEDEEEVEVASGGFGVRSPVVPNLKRRETVRGLCLCVSACVSVSVSVCVSVSVSVSVSLPLLYLSAEVLEDDKGNVEENVHHNDRKQTLNHTSKEGTNC